MPASRDRDFALTRSVLAAGLAARAFPAATIMVGRASGPLWTHACGRLTYDADAPACTADTLFDLASLTKVIATTSFALHHVASGRLDLAAPVGVYLPKWTDTPATVQVRHLLDHSSGFPAHGRLWESTRGRGEYEAAIRAVVLDRAPGEASVYSDLGFILLGFILEHIGGPLDEQMRALAARLDLSELGYQPPVDLNPRIAPTEFDPWRNRLLIGEVHDENAAALDGVAGHAGLFGPVAAVGTFAATVLQSFRAETAVATPPLMSLFASRTGVPGSSRALGWDTMLPTSSCGTRFSPRAIGHTGFTGTSLWIDPERDLYVALLSNRVHPTRANEALRALRPRVHDAVVEDLR